MATRRLPPGLEAYFRSRVIEIARPETRAAADPLGQWTVRKIRLDGRPFTFEGHRYLVAIYDDTAPHIVLCKAAQIGGTTWAVLRSVHACINGLNVIYFFPTRTDVLEFSKSRVGPLLAGNPFLAKLLKDTDTAGLKRIGEASLFFRGMQSEVGMKSVAADMVVFDELDETTPEAKALAKERLSHSGYKRLLELSNPSLPGYGIDQAFQTSDQRHWTVRCTSCSTWTSLDLAFPTRLGEEVRVLRRRADGSVYRACPKCDAVLDVETGEWVAAFPSRPTHGYRISQLFSGRVEPAEILEEYETTRFPEQFFNLKIGIPWADTQNRVDRAAVLACCGDEPIWQRVGNYDHCTMGVDIGKQLHVVISRGFVGEPDRRQVVYLGVHDSYAELDDLMTRFKVRECVVDAMPELHATRAFAQRHAGRVWMCFFNENQKGRPHWNSDEWIVQVNRTEALDLSRAVLRERRWMLPRVVPVVEEFAAHVASNAKRLEENPQTGEQRYNYLQAGPDHFSMALTYDCLVAQRDIRWADPPPRSQRERKPDPILDAEW